MTQKVLTQSDFEAMLDSYAGRQVSHIVVTKTTSNISGQESLSEASPVNIKAYFMRTAQNWDYQKSGFFEKGDAVMLAQIPAGVTIDDIIIVEGEKFRVKEAFDVPGVYDSTGSNSIYVYTACNLFLYE